jgi:glycosyltransferase involved in cell wall biosynthesis
MVEGITKREYILITSQNFPEGGAGATYLNLFCRGLHLNDNSISVLLLKGFAFGNFEYRGSWKNFTEYGVPYTYLGFTQRPRNQLLKLIEELISILHLTFFLFSLAGKRKSVTLLVFNSEIQSNIPIHCISKLLRIRLVKFIAEFIDKSQFQGSFLRKIKWFGFLLNFKYFNNISDKLIVFSFFLKQEYLKMGYNEKNIIIQPNLTDFGFWFSGNSEIKHTIGYSGAPYLKDGLLDLFNAINILQNEGINVNLLVIGDATFGKSLIPTLKEECRKLNISEKVSFTGLVDSAEVKRHLSECMFLAITRPSTIQTQAGFPTKLGEYFATMKPVLTTNFGDVERYFENGIDLVMAETGNPESIALKIKWMLQNSDALETISRNGYRKAKDLLDYQKAIQRIIEFIN